MAPPWSGAGVDSPGEAASLARFWVFVLIPFNAITNHLWNLHSWPEIKPEPLEWEC